MSMADGSKEERVHPEESVVHLRVEVQDPAAVAQGALQVPVPDDGGSVESARVAPEHLTP